MRIIDCRFRPLTPEFMHFISPEPRNFRLMKSTPPTPEPLESYATALAELGVVKAVVSGRDNTSRGGKAVRNEYIADLVRQYPDLYIGVAGIDPGKGEGALADVEHAVTTLGMKGISIDPFLMQGDAADQRLYPLYQKCSDLGVPVFMTFGPLPGGKGKMRWGSPLPVDDVAADFPKLKILASHAGFPFTQELIALVWRNDNVYFESSLYRHMPGADLLVEAVNTIIPHKMVYASAYPFMDYKESLRRFLAMPYAEEILPGILYENAERLLNIRA